MESKLGAGSLQQPNVSSSVQQPSRGSNVLQGSLQQSSKLGSLQQPTQLGPYQQSSQLGSYQQPSLSSNVLQGSLQQQRQQLIKSDRGSMLSLSDDSVMVKQIRDTHAPDGRKVDNMSSLLLIVEAILSRATPNPDGILTMGTQEQILEEKTEEARNFLESLQDPQFAIDLDRISRELSYKANGTDAHANTLSIFRMLFLHDWDAKLVLTLAAFALNYGNFGILFQSNYLTNPLAKAMALLRSVRSIIEHAGTVKPRFDALNDLNRAILEVTQCVVAVEDITRLSSSSQYITNEFPALSTAMAYIPTTVYWCIRSIVVSGIQISGFTELGSEFALISATEAHWEFSTLTLTLKNMRDHLKKQLEMCYQQIEGKRDEEYNHMLVNLFEMIHIDNMRVLRALIYPRDDDLQLIYPRDDDLQPLVDGSTKKRVNIDVLRRKNVLLLISSLDISQGELSFLEQIYNESRQHSTRLDNHFEIVWIPVVDHSIQWTGPIQKQFDSLQSTMPWYTVHHPSLIGKPVVKFIKEKWHFRNKPILVVLDPQGKLVSPNAIHMMWIWGSSAFPFTSFREEVLWREETWKLELLVDGIDQLVLNWIKDGKYIFLYGGDDTEWLQKFANAARAVAAAAHIPLEMVYVGKGSKREQIQRVITTITVEKMGYYWQDLAMIWFFWTRLESMLFSKIQLGKADDHADPVMHGIKKLLSYNKEGGWAVLSKGSSIVVNGHGNKVLLTLLEYDTWKENVALQGFDVAFKNHYDMLYGVSHPCGRFEFSHIAGRIPEGIRCHECHRDMEKYTTFLCCHDEGVPSILY